MHPKKNPQKWDRAAVPYVLTYYRYEKMEGWGKIGVQSANVLYRNLCYNKPCYIEVQVYYFSCFVTNFMFVQAFRTKLRDLKQMTRNHRRNPSISILPLPSNRFWKTMCIFRIIKRKEEKMYWRIMTCLICS